MLNRITKFTFSKSYIQVLYLRDSQHGFEGEVAKVKPGFAYQHLIPKGFAVQNIPGFSQRLLPHLNQDTLQLKLQRKAQIKGFNQKLKSIFLDFTRQPKFSNPNLLKEPITEVEIIEELKSRYKLQIDKNNILSMQEKISQYGQVQIIIENYFSQELQQQISFPIQILVKKPILKTAKLIDNTNEEGNASKQIENQTKEEQVVAKEQ